MNLTIYDFMVLGFYFVFIVVIACVFKRFNKNTSDYFRGGGSMLWWVAGISGFMGAISAFTFTGAAGKTYQVGLLIPLIYLIYAAAAVFVYFVTAARFRQMRVVTYVEALRNRYGPLAEQFYTWTAVPVSLALGAIQLYSIAVFTAGVFDVRLELILIALGSIMTIIAFLGGAWAVAASDFLQFILIISITIVAAVLSLHEVGGISGFISKLPASHLHWSQAARPEIITLWLIAFTISNFIGLNNLGSGPAYFQAKDTHHARKAALVYVVGYAFAGLVWFIPPMTAAILFPDIRAAFPQFGNRALEASYVAVCFKILPQGLIGMLTCAIFSAAVSHSTAAYNRNAGVFVRSFYKVLRPASTETHLLAMSRLTTLLIGAIVIFLAYAINFVLNNYKDIRLFDILQIVTALFGIPVSVPLVLAILTKRGTGLTACSTSLVGMIIVALLNYVEFPRHIHDWLNWNRPLSTREFSDLTFAASVITGVGVCTAWYFIVSRFDKPTLPKARSTDDFFTKLHTPVNAAAEGITDTDEKQFRILGVMAFIYAGFILLCCAIPNPVTGRLCFAFCGSVFLVTALLLCRTAAKHRHASTHKLSRSDTNSDVL
jgi:SSS family solute:Na+ symporter